MGTGTHLVIAATLVAAAAAAAPPPPGHPSVEDAERLLQLPSEDVPLRHTGQVIEAIDSNQYTYVQLRQGQATQWLAVPRIEVKPGMWIRYGEGRLMRNWYSRKLKRSFDDILFVSRVEIVAHSA